MNQHLRKALDRIKSGVYPKTRNKFTDGRGSFCILGALTKSYEEQTGDILYPDGVYLYSEELDEDRLAERVAQYYGFQKETLEIAGEPLYNLNDDTNYTLPELAQMIEDHEKELCIPPKAKRTKKAALPAGAVPVPVLLTGREKEKVQ